MAKPSVLSVVDALYTAALDPERWDDALSAVSQSVGAIGTCMVPIGAGTVMRSITSESLAEANVAYQETWWRMDTPTARLVSRGVRPGSVGTDRVVMEEAEIRRDPFYQEFLAAHGIGQSLAAVASLGSGRLLSIAAQRSLKKGLYERDEVETMAVLSPHIGRAISIATSLVEARRVAGDLANAIERLAWGVVLLDTKGNVRHVNAVAETLMGDGLSVSHRRVRAASRDDDTALQTAIKAALPDTRIVPSNGVMVRRPSGRPPFFVEVAPVRPRLDALEIMTFGAGGVMLLIRSSASAPKDVVHHLRAMGLTPAEARLAEIIGRGHTLRAVAEMSGITYETARAHLRSVFAKLSIRRQADLVVLVTRLTANISS